MQKKIQPVYLAMKSYETSFSVLYVFGLLFDSTLKVSHYAITTDRNHRFCYEGLYRIQTLDLSAVVVVLIMCESDLDVN